MTSTDSIKLTRFSHGAGCACKLPLSTLDEVLQLLGPQEESAHVLVGLNEADDAAVIRLDDEDSLVITLDFFTPLVDDAYTWGRIASTNAASDVYAMGGRPIVALNIVAWPREALGVELLAKVLEGGRDVARAGGFAIVGGHSIDDPEPKFGQVVVGRVRTDQLMTMDAARPGDVLVLTKPIGTGMITTAIKSDVAPPEAIEAAVASMTTLNNDSAALFVAHGVRACTDVTGFGLLGHLRRMLAASGAAAEIDAAAVPMLGGAVELARAGQIPGGTKRNLEAVDPSVTWNGATDLTKAMLSDAQTSGGLLGSCRSDAVDGLIGALDGQLACAVIGRVTEGDAGTIAVSGQVASG